ncbi:MAG: DUF6883 domain-containing protein [Candidatus Scalinduaceae bacterium]
MKLPENTSISPEKLTQYLLTLRKRNDKSLWLAKAGYTIENWRSLEEDLRTQILTLDAELTENTKYGKLYEIRGKLTGPNGKTLSICTIWMTETMTGVTKLITIYPGKGGKYDL